MKLLEKFIRFKCQNILVVTIIPHTAVYNLCRHIMRWLTEIEKLFNGSALISLTIVNDIIHNNIIDLM